MNRREIARARRVYGPYRYFIWQTFIWFAEDTTIATGILLIVLVAHVILAFAEAHLAGPDPSIVYVVFRYAFDLVGGAGTVIIYTADIIFKVRIALRRAFGPLPLEGEEI